MAISRSKLKKGAIETYITLEPTSNDVKIESIKIKIKGTYTAPTLTPNVTTVDLGNVTDQTKSSFTLSPKGVGSISYTITSSKAWLSVDKSSFTFTGNSANTVNLDINTKEMDHGDNDAVLTITPTINEQKEAPIQISVKGNFNKVTNLVGDYTLTKNETWSGTVNIAGDVKVPNGITLTVKPGTVISFNKSPLLAYTISVNSGAKLDIKGTADQPITFKSSKENPTNFDWGGISIFGVLEAQYCIFANAGSAINSFQYSDSSIKNCLFYNNYKSLSYLFNKNINVLVKNCTFSKSGGAKLSTHKGVVTISNCNFNSVDDYDDDVAITGSSNNVTISQSNFPNKNYAYVYNVNLREDKDYVSNVIKADNCYNLKSIKALKYGNVFEQSNPSGTKIANAGCGFEDKFTQFINNTSSKISIEDKRAILKEQMDQLKAKYLQK
jgi:hypothetical protein